MIGNIFEIEIKFIGEVLVPKFSQFTLSGFISFEDQVNLNKKWSFFTFRVNSR